MKRFLLILLCAALFLTLCSCVIADYLRAPIGPPYIADESDELGGPFESDEPGELDD